jgi:hypothetical protein
VQGDPGAQGPQGDPGLQGPPGPSNLILGGGSRNTNLANGPNNWIPLYLGVLQASEAPAQQVVPLAGTVSKFYVRLSGTPGNGRSYTFTVRVNGADTAVTCVVQDAATGCSDTTNSVTLAAGDLIAIHAVGTANPTGRTMVWTALFAQ